MDWTIAPRGLRQETLRERLRVLAAKARKSPRSLSLEDLDELCTLVIELGPGASVLSRDMPPDPIEAQPDFESLLPDPLRPEAQAILRQAHALEYIALQLGELVRLKKEAALLDKRPAELDSKDRSS